MNKEEAIKTFFSNPVRVLINGIRASYENYMKEQVWKKHKKKELDTIDFLEIIPDCDITIDNYSYMTGTSMVTDIVLLKSLAKRFDSCSYLEIGSWRGESLVNVAEVANNCTSITLSSDEMRKLKFSEDIIKSHGFFLKGCTNIKTYYHNSATFDFNSLNKKYDLIFVDGDHSYKGVLSDTKNVFKLLKDENSIIVWHDYGFNVADVRHSVLAAILDGIPTSEHRNLYHVSNTLCAIYSKGNFGKSISNSTCYPDKKFRVNLKARRI